MERSVVGEREERGERGERLENGERGEMGGAEAIWRRRELCIKNKFTYKRYTSQLHMNCQTLNTFTKRKHPYLQFYRIHFSNCLYLNSENNLLFTSCVMPMENAIK
uniref:Uncharacterized protein n=1 Tax=Glossina brevipalpis TaxID=37001 RepID=A0A1A9WBU6_9MUSC